MRVEPAERPFDGVVNQFLGRHLVDVLILYDREYLGEQPELLVRPAAIGALAGHGAPEGEGEHHEQ